MKAIVEVTHGRKGINQFLRAAGLGLTGAFTTERWPEVCGSLNAIEHPMELS